MTEPIKNLPRIPGNYRVSIQTKEAVIEKTLWFSCDGRWHLSKKVVGTGLDFSRFSPNAVLRGWKLPHGTHIIKLQPSGAFLGRSPGIGPVMEIERAVTYSVYEMTRVINRMLKLLHPQIPTATEIKWQTP